MAAQPEAAFIRAGTAPGVRRTGSGGARAAFFHPDVPSDRDVLDRLPGRGPELVARPAGSSPAWPSTAPPSIPSSLFGPRRVRV